jgi:hypothetical protein
LPTKSNICGAYFSVEAQLKKYIKENNNTVALSDLYGKVARLAFHDAGEVLLNDPTDVFGSDGCLSHTGDNAGLFEANSIVTTIFEPIWQSVCDQISRADFWVLFAKLALEKADPTSFLNIPYQYGRKDNTDCEGGAGRLPNPQQGNDIIEKVFVNQMGLKFSDAGKVIAILLCISSLKYLLFVILNIQWHCLVHTQWDIFMLKTRDMDSMQVQQVPPSRPMPSTRHPQYSTTITSKA